MSERRRPVVAIDGPAGAGKSTVTGRVARALGYLLVDTGALYRAVALAAARSGIDFEDIEGVGRTAEAVVARDALCLADGGEGSVRVLLDGEDVSTAIRTQELGQGASKVSAQPRVRAALLELQRSAGRNGGVVLEGRDIGTVVFPDAHVKVFLTASAEERARRRALELETTGQIAPYDVILDEIRRRDKADTERAVAPLLQADDAVLVDSSYLTEREVVDSIVALVTEARIP
jgi:cytidylate kinase